MLVDSSLSNSPQFTMFFFLNLRLKFLKPNYFTTKKLYQIDSFPLQLYFLNLFFQYKSVYLVEMELENNKLKFSELFYYKSLRLFSLTTTVFE